MRIQPWMGIPFFHGNTHPSCFAIQWLGGGGAELRVSQPHGLPYCVWTFNAHVSAIKGSCAKSKIYIYFAHKDSQAPLKMAWNTINLIFGSACSQSRVDFDDLRYCLNNFYHIPLFQSPTRHGFLKMGNRILVCRIFRHTHRCTALAW